MALVWSLGPAAAPTASSGRGADIAVALAAIVVLLVIVASIDRRKAAAAKRRKEEIEFKQHQKDLVYREAGGRCEYCRARIKPGKPGLLDTWKTYQCDHILPVKLGGLPELANAAAACAECNKMKAGGTWDEFERAFRQRHGYRPRRPKGHAQGR